MNADFVEVARFTGVGAAYLGLVAVNVYLLIRVTRWVARAAPREKCRLARALLGFLLGHGLTIILGGFAFVLFLFGFHNKLSAAERAEFLTCMRACFVVGPALALAAWVSLRYIHRHRTRSNPCA